MNHRQFHPLAWAAAGALCTGLVCLGCGPRPVVGGTPGKLRAAADPLPDVRIEVYLEEQGALRPVGFGVTRADGAFELTQPEARGPLALPPGTYRFTLESVGAVPLEWSAEFGQPEQTPLRREWTGADRALDLDVPAPRAAP